MIGIIDYQFINIDRTFIHRKNRIDCCQGDQCALIIMVCSTMEMNRSPWVIEQARLEIVRKRGIQNPSILQFQRKPTLCKTHGDQNACYIGWLGNCSLVQAHSGDLPFHFADSRLDLKTADNLDVFEISD